MEHNFQHFFRARIGKREILEIEELIQLSTYKDSRKHTLYI